MTGALNIRVEGDDSVLRVLSGLRGNLARALGRAILQEANDLRGMMVKGIRDQAPGGQKFKPLSEITRRLRLMQKKKGQRILGGWAKRRADFGRGMPMQWKTDSGKTRSNKAWKASRAAEKVGAATEGMKALINSSSLLRSINVTKVRSNPLDGVFVGVHRNARRKAGAKVDPVSIAAVHENGSKSYSVNVTKKMRGWWFAMYKAGVFNSPLKKSTTSLKMKIPARPFVRPTVAVWKRDLEKRLAQRMDQEVRAIVAKEGGKAV